MKFLNEYIAKFALREVINSMDERRVTDKESIIFPNGYVASICYNSKNINAKKDDTSCTVATCDYDGYFNWDILNQFGNDQYVSSGIFHCKTELDLLIALESIRRLPSCCDEEFDIY